MYFFFIKLSADTQRKTAIKMFNHTHKNNKNMIKMKRNIWGRGSIVVVIETEIFDTKNDMSI